MSGKRDVSLKYTGNGSFIPDVPARDLTADEVTAAGGEESLLESGIYKRAPKKKAPAASKKPTGKGSAKAADKEA